MPAGEVPFFPLEKLRVNIWRRTLLCDRIISWSVGQLLRIKEFGLIFEGSDSLPLVFSFLRLMLFRGGVTAYDRHAEGPSLDIWHHLLNILRRINNS